MTRYLIIWRSKAFWVLAKDKQDAKRRLMKHLKATGVIQEPEEVARQLAGRIRLILASRIPSYSLCLLSR